MNDRYTSGPSRGYMESDEFPSYNPAVHSDRADRLVASANREYHGATRHTATTRICPRCGTSGRMHRRRPAPGLGWILALFTSRRRYWCRSCGSMVWISTDSAPRLESIIKQAFGKKT